MHHSGGLPRPAPLLPLTGVANPSDEITSWTHKRSGLSPADAEQEGKAAERPDLPSGSILGGMSFRKPFRAVPVELGVHCQAGRRRQRWQSVFIVFGGAPVAGLSIGWLTSPHVGVATTSGAASTGVRPASRAVYYAGCNEARAAGAAPIYAGEPGYRPEMDGDGDGIACEPYRGG